MIVIPSYRGPIYASSVGGGGEPPTLRSTVYVYGFFDSEMIVNRYDSTNLNVTTTARGWFFR